MPRVATTGVTMVTVMALTQLCPAPWAAIAAGAASGAVAGSVAGSIGKRDVSVDALYRRQDAPEGVNQQDFDRCLNDVASQAEPVHVSNSEIGRYLRARKIRKANDKMLIHVSRYSR